MNKKFYKSIIFSKTPLKTFLKLGNYFQIYPCDFPEAPSSIYCHDFPLVVEYWVDADEKINISEEWDDSKELISNITIQNIKLNRITRFLSSITNNRFFSYTETEFKWGVPLTDDALENKEINNKSSQAILSLFTYPNMYQDLKIKDFSARRHPLAKLISHSVYYMYNPIEDKDKEITFPNTIFQTTEKYFSTSDTTVKVINSITHLICNGIDIRNKMKSLSFISFVSAIETIVNYEFKDKKDTIEFECADCQAIKESPLKCHKCGRPIWGVKAKFREFLKKYVSDGENSVKKYNRIYNLRSDIVHNGMLLLGDEHINWEKSHKADSQYMTHLETMQLARLSMVNWLLLGPNRI